MRRNKKHKEELFSAQNIIEAQRLLDNADVPRENRMIAETDENGTRIFHTGMGDYISEEEKQMQKTQRQIDITASIAFILICLLGLLLICQPIMK